MRQREMKSKGKKQSGVSTLGPAAAGQASGRVVGGS